MIARSRIVPEDVVVIMATNPMVVSRWKGKFGASRNLLLRAADYDTVRHRTMLPFKKIK